MKSSQACFVLAWPILFCYLYSMPDTNWIAFKQQIKQACLARIDARIRTAEEAMRTSQEAANSEDKSSAGDKYETARAMGQADRDMNARQLQEALNERKILGAISCDERLSAVAPGALVGFDGKWFFVAIGLGSITINDVTVVVLSAVSPLYRQLHLKKRGEQVTFQNRSCVITDVF